ncbi:hypothetical protein CABS01_16385 [Colletotrichum abscissum]|uniref:uncharacterized protein n=1 Tax=Colletotrichum abscissum TaxID=1671311 RepID=UPI0027D6B8B2|nr:uncharacterized protein CABS01_16385 [Colletotrichum abscissum]KAK1471342.1 hypothetical protein CABS01_16385 [Colletotrichum abscissum]
MTLPPLAWLVGSTVQGPDDVECVPPYERRPDQAPPAATRRSNAILTARDFTLCYCMRPKCQPTNLPCGTVSEGWLMASDVYCHPGLGQSKWLHNTRSRRVLDGELPIPRDVSPAPPSMFRERDNATTLQGAVVSPK